jgi:hypothetical protein
VDAILSLLGIVIGLTIFFMQRRADTKINGIIETQFRRQQLEKNYFGTRLMRNLELIRKNYGKLAKFLSDYLRERSSDGKSKVRSFCDFQATNLDEYVVPAMRGDLGHLIEFIDDLELVDQLSSAFDGFSSIYKDLSLDSAFQAPDTELSGRLEEAQERSKKVELILSRLGQEIPKTDGLTPSK